MNYYPFHVGDYSSHTKHLTLMGDLAYRRLLDLYYINEKPLPLDPAECARLIGMRDQISDVSEVLSDFFLKSEAGWINKRADEEIAVYRKKADRARNAGKQRWKSDPAPISDADKSATNNQEPITKNQEKALTTTAADEKPRRQPKQARIAFDLEAGSFRGITEADELRWQDAYPAVPIPPEISRAAAWLKANPANKKSNCERFLVNWFSRAQDKAARVR